MITDQVLQDRIQELLYLGFEKNGYYHRHRKAGVAYSTADIQSYDAERWVEELDYLYQALGEPGK